MPVDLSAIPPVVKRKKCPSLKRWSVALLILLLCWGFIALKLWPSGHAANGALFWHCLISAPLILWLVVFSLRWLIWLVSEWLADGWDSEREADMTAEISRGQRFFSLEAVSIRLPHVVGYEALAEQFLLPKAVVLPVVVDESTRAICHQASFNNTGQPVLERIVMLFISLLDGAKINTALTKRKVADKLPAIIQIDTDSILSEEELLTVKIRLRNYIQYYHL